MGILSYSFPCDLTLPRNLPASLYVSDLHDFSVAAGSSALIFWLARPPCIRHAFHHDAAFPGPGALAETHGT